jgi:hypothetical protein
VFFDLLLNPDGTQPSTGIGNGGGTGKKVRTRGEGEAEVSCEYRHVEARVPLPTSAVLRESKPSWRKPYQYIPEQLL